MNKIERIRKFLMLSLPVACLFLGAQDRQGAIGGAISDYDTPVGTTGRERMSVQDAQAFLDERYAAHTATWTLPEELGGTRVERDKATMADTAYAVFGPLPSGYLVEWNGRQQDGMTTGGVYNSDTDKIALNARELGDSVLDHSFIHELTHRVQSRYGVSMDTWWRHEKIIPNVGRYGALVMCEQQAEATAYAFEYLRETAGATDATVESRRLAALEAQVPGTRTMVERLLAFPIYDAHPLRTGLLKLEPAITVGDLPWSVDGVDNTPTDSVSRFVGRDGFTTYKLALELDSATMNVSVDSARKVVVTYEGEYPDIRLAMIRMVDLYDLDRGWRGHPVKRVR